MERKARIGTSAFVILGAVYALLGGLFLILGTVFALMIPEVGILGPAFISIGGLFFGLGAAFLGAVVRKKRQADRLIAAGQYVWGQVVDLQVNYNVTVNRRHPVVILAQYTDGQGARHIFRSPSVRMFRDPSLIGKPVKIYYRDDTFKAYYMDVEPLLPNVIEHG